jgi:hypothetical protein
MEISELLEFQGGGNSGVKISLVPLCSLTKEKSQTLKSVKSTWQVKMIQRLWIGTQACLLSWIGHWFPEYSQADCFFMFFSKVSFSPVVHTEWDLRPERCESLGHPLFWSWRAWWPRLWGGELGAHGFQSLASLCVHEFLHSFTLNDSI